MDTKDTKEIIKALNPKYELKASIQKEKEFLELRNLNQAKKQSVFKKGYNYLSNKTRKMFTPKPKPNNIRSTTNSSYKSFKRFKRPRVSNILPK